MNSSQNPATKAGYNRFLLLVAGLGGLLYGIDVGIISGALPYLQDTFTLPNGSLLSSQQISLVVAAVLLGTVFSTLFAGALADLFGRRTLMTLSGLLFVLSVPVIALAHSYGLLVFGRILQGISGGLIGVAAPLYLAECLGASSRGKGTGIFQWLLVLGIVAASLIGLYFSSHVDAVAQLGDAQKLFAAKESAWRSIFWVSLPPGILFLIGTFMVAESPRWLFRRGKIDAARAALLRSRNQEQAETELKEMEQIVAEEKNKVSTSSEKTSESLLHRKYVIPFILACVILSCNQATGINSVIGYNTTILIQAGLGDHPAHDASLIFNFVNFVITLFAVLLVDRKGRKFLLTLGTAGVIISMLCAGLLFHRTEKLRVDVKDAMQTMVSTNQTLMLTFDKQTAANLQPSSPLIPQSLVIIYSYGDFSAATPAMRSDDPSAKPIQISRDDCIPANKVIAFFKNPFASLDAARTAPLKIDNALITPIPDAQNGWLTAIALYVYMAFFAIGPGVCVWLALSELMPTRIRSNGMSIALLINQAVSTTIAAIFLPSVGKYGYSTMFFLFAGCTVIYFVTAAFFLPETKGKTLEEIEEYFEGGKKL
ncbi:MAG TPA: MFS transporter [Candidatus Acidoferrales bacterium]|jgi:SP family myo-inositol transporter-like MFS transporter 13|nr:MFS transporter [Candidatus Acidoferrales bacterium]